jgi:hypothetical protein
MSPPARGAAAIQNDAVAVHTYSVAIDKRGFKGSAARFRGRKCSDFHRDELIAGVIRFAGIQRARGGESAGRMLAR